MAPAVADKVTTVPLGPAYPFRTNVPVAAFPPTTDDGLMLRVVSPAGVTVRVAVFEPVPLPAVIVATT